MRRGHEVRADGAGDRGWVTAFTAILAGAMIFVVGLVVDGGRQINAVMRASDLASNAARAAAQELEPGSLYSGEQPRIDAGSAETRAADYLSAAGYPGSLSEFVVSADLRTVTVTVSLSHEPLILVDFGGETVTATASSTAIQGVDEELPE